MAEAALAVASAGVRQILTSATAKTAAEIDLKEEIDDIRGRLKKYKLIYAEAGNVATRTKLGLCSRK
jgi:hypothetical protein